MPTGDRGEDVNDDFIYRKKKQKTPQQGAADNVSSL